MKLIKIFVSHVALLGHRMNFLTKIQKYMDDTQNEKYKKKKNTPTY